MRRRQRNVGLSRHEDGCEVSVVRLDSNSVPVGFNMDATYSNRFHCWVDRTTVRIIFGDSVDGDHMRWFGAVAMPRDVAKELLKAMKNSINETD